MRSVGVLSEYSQQLYWLPKRLFWRMLQWYCTSNVDPDPDQRCECVAVLCAVVYPDHNVRGSESWSRSGWFVVLDIVHVIYAMFLEHATEARTQDLFHHTLCQFCFMINKPSVECHIHVRVSYTTQYQQLMRCRESRPNLVSILCTRFYFIAQPHLYWNNAESILATSGDRGLSVPQEILWFLIFASSHVKQVESSHLAGCVVLASFITVAKNNIKLELSEFDEVDTEFAILVTGNRTSLNQNISNKTSGCNFLPKYSLRLSASSGFYCYFRSARPCTPQMDSMMNKIQNYLTSFPN